MKTKILTALTLAALLGACGSGSSSGPTGPILPTPSPAPVSTVISQGSGSVPSKNVGPVTFTTTATGTLGVTVDWTFASNDVDIFIVRGTAPCTLTSFNNRTCGFIATSESTTQKPEKLSINNLAAGAYTLYVGNFGSSDESVAWQIVLTTGAGTSGSSLSGSGVGGPVRAKGALDRILEPR